MEKIVVQIESRLPLTRESRRIFHGRGHCFPGFEDLTIDWFYPVLLVITYSPWEDCRLSCLTEQLRKLIPESEVVLLQERRGTEVIHRVLWGSLPREVEAVEAGLRYRLSLGSAQNAGFFLDMAIGRSLLRERSQGKKVLNLFAYTCSFSVAAIAGGAAGVVNLDMNRNALNLGRLNHKLNGQDLRTSSFLPHDLFRSFGKLKKLGPYDLIVCDPPADQGKSFHADRDWPKLVARLPDLLSPRGELFACLNGPKRSPDFLKDLFSAIAPQLKLIQKLRPGPDFPENEPDKGVWLFHYQRQNN